MNLLILAAGKGSRIYDEINTHKCLLKINNVSLIEKIVDDATKTGIFKKILIVVGFKKNLIIKKLSKKKNIFLIKNSKFNTTEMSYSLLLGLKKSQDDTIVCYSDIYFSKKIFQKINKVRLNHKIILPINMKWKETWVLRNKSFKSDCETLKINKKNILIEIGKKIKNYNDVHGQYMGIFYIEKEANKSFQNIFVEKLKNRKIHITSFLNSIKNIFDIFCIKTKDYWYEFDDYDDYINYQKNKNKKNKKK